MYQLFIDPLSSSQIVWRMNADGTISSIPMDDENTDYQAYLKWVEAGGVAEVTNETV